MKAKVLIFLSQIIFLVNCNRNGQVNSLLNTRRIQSQSNMECFRYFDWLGLRGIDPCSFDSVIPPYYEISRSTDSITILFHIDYESVRQFKYLKRGACYYKLEKLEDFGYETYVGIGIELFDTLKRHQYHYIYYSSSHEALKDEFLHQYTIVTDDKQIEIFLIPEVGINYSPDCDLIPIQPRHVSRITIMRSKDELYPELVETIRDTSLIREFIESGYE